MTIQGGRQRRRPSGRGDGRKRATAAETRAGKAARAGPGAPAAGLVNEPTTPQNINDRQTNRGGGRRRRGVRDDNKDNNDEDDNDRVSSDRR
jgi:hypothetical protein